jgi:hypothetical protein
VKGALIWGFLSLALFIAGAVLSVPKVAGYLGWPVWLVFVLLLIDLALVSAIPFSLREYVGTATLRHRDGQFKFAGFLAGCAWLLIIGTVIVPALIFVWVLVVILQ